MATKRLPVFGKERRLPYWKQTDVGRKRTNNEDAMIADDELGLFGVADGMGGLMAGEVASADAIKLIVTHLSAHRELIADLANPQAHRSRKRLERVFLDALREANRGIHEKARSIARQARMGTTFCGALISERQALIAHVGDSRAYLSRAGQTYQVTQDHSLVNEQVRRGLLTEESAKISPHRHVLIKALGIDPVVEPDIVPLELCEGDRLLFCTDGVTDQMYGGTLSQLLSERDGARAVELIIDQANAAGGKDNSTVVLVEIRPSRETAAHPVDPEAKLRALWHLPMFHHLEYAELVKLMSITSSRVYRQGEIVFAENEPGDTFFVVVEGAMDVVSGGDVLTTIKPGEHVGELALIDGSPRSATVGCTTETKALVISQQDFYQLIRREPLLASKLLWRFGVQMAARIRELTARVRDLSR